MCFLEKNLTLKKNSLGRKMLVHLPHCLEFFIMKFVTFTKKVKTLVSSTCLLVPLVLAFHIDNVIMVATT